MHAEMLGCLEDHASLARAEGRIDAACALYSACAVLRERLALKRSHRAEMKWSDEVARLRASAGDKAFDEAWALGRTWDLEETISRALADSARPLVLA